MYKWVTKASDFWVSDGKAMCGGEYKAVSVNIKKAVSASA
jgi:hypothetical protein